MPNGRTLEQAEKQLTLLAAENRRLAAELEGLQNQGLVLEKAARDARTVQVATERVSAGLKSKLEASEKQSAESREANKALTAQVARLGKQVEKTAFNPLTVEEGSALFERLIGAFHTSNTLEVRQASLNLKLATAKLGDTAVLVLPDPKSVDPATLHELRIDLTSVTGAKLGSELAPLPTPVLVSRIVTDRTVRRAANKTVNRAAKATTKRGAKAITKRVAKVPARKRR